MSENPLENIDSAAPSTIDQTALDKRSKLKHLLVGKPAVVKLVIHRLHKSGYAEVREWSKPISAANSLGEPGDVISVLIKQIASDT